jgi:hypothetical protein
VQTAQNVFSISGNWYDADFCWHDEYDVAYGSPLAPAARTGTYTWSRVFTRCNVTVDVAAGTGEIFLME